MRWGIGVVAGLLVLAGAGVAGADQPDLEQLPQQVWNVAMEPLSSVARETRRFDPISQLWFHLLESSMKSVERTANLLFRTGSDAPAPRNSTRLQALYSL